VCSATNRKVLQVTPSPFFFVHSDSIFIPVTRRVKGYTRFVGKYVTGRRKQKCSRRFFAVVLVDLWNSFDIYSCNLHHSNAASMQQGDEPRFSRTMRRHKRESWDSTAFHLFLEILRSGFPLWMRPSKTRSLVISTKETDGWILDRGIAAFSPQPLLGWAYPDRS